MSIAVLTCTPGTIRQGAIQREITSPRIAPCSLSDEDVLKRCAQHDEQAFSELFFRYNSSIFRFISRLTGSSPDTEDLVQKTFIEVWKSSERFNCKWKPKSWIFGIAANLTRHHFRSEKRRTSAIRTLASEPEARVRQPFQDLEREELIRILAQELQNIPFDLRVAYLLCDVEGERGVDTARALGIRPGTLWRRLHHARKALQERMQAYDPV